MIRVAACIILCGIVLAYSPDGLAYMGPALGLGIVGTAVAVIAVSLLSLFAFVILPIRRMLGKSRKKPDHDNSDPEL